MTMAPNKSEEQYKRKNELFKLQGERKLTVQELYELRDLTRAASSHLIPTSIVRRVL